ncbi:MAG: IS4 family transposase [Candidatus Sulfotelmatobacter sp.]
MTRVSSIFSQLLQLFSRLEFQSAVQAHKAERHARGFTCWGQFVAMVFCQLGRAQSLREICGGLAASEGKLKHLGLPRAPSRSTLSYANEHRPWQLYETVFHQLLEKCQGAAASQPGKKKRKFRFKNRLLSLDASVISLCASVFDWAQYRRRKGAVKLHLLLDHDGYLPSFAVVTEGKTSEIKVARTLRFEPGTILAIDRGYIDYEWFRELTQEEVYFVTRMKEKAVYEIKEELEVPQNRNVVRDQIICFPRLAREGEEPVLFRRVEIWDAEKEEAIVFLSNLLAFGATTIAAIYKDRWEVGVSSQGHINQPVQVRPRLTDSSLVAWEASWSESETMKPSDNMLRKEYAQLTRLQRTVNADVASSHANPEAETVYNVRKQQEPIETSPMRRLSPAGYQRRHGEKENVETGEAPGVRRRNLVEEATAITASGKCRRRRQGGGSGRSTVDGRAAKRVRRKGPGPVSTPLDKVRQG